MNMFTVYAGNRYDSYAIGGASFNSSATYKEIMDAVTDIIHTHDYFFRDDEGHYIVFKNEDFFTEVEEICGEYFAQLKGHGAYSRPVSCCEDGIFWLRKIRDHRKAKPRPVNHRVDPKVMAIKNSSFKKEVIRILDEEKEA